MNKIVKYWRKSKKNKALIISALVIIFGIGVSGNSNTNNESSHQPKEQITTKVKSQKSAKEKLNEKYEVYQNLIENKGPVSGANEQESSIFAERKKQALDLVSRKAPAEEVEKAISALDMTNRDISTRKSQEAEQAKIAEETAHQQAEQQRVAAEQAHVQTITVQDNVEQTVYIAPHSGTKYHYHQGCRGLSNANSISALSLSSAVQQGYSLCKWED